MSIPAEVRSHCAALAARARHVRIEPGASTITGGSAGLDPSLHFLEGDAEAVARYVLVLDAINFGSGWFPTLRGDGEGTGTDSITRRLTGEARRRGGPWTAAELRGSTTEGIAALLAEDPGHPLMALYADALRQLGSFLGGGGALDAIAAAGGSAARFAAALVEGMPAYADPGFFKRAQITANDLVLAGVAAFEDADELTVFADNLLPHVLRLDGVLVYDDALAARIDAGEPLPAGSPAEQELRACAVHACEGIAARLGVAPRVLDNWLWNRGQEPPYAARRPHLTRTTAY
jgi:Potential Queuosine, Q, salvage protein family